MLGLACRRMSMPVLESRPPLNRNAKRLLKGGSKDISVDWYFVTSNPWGKTCISTDIYKHLLIFQLHHFCEEANTLLYSAGTTPTYIGKDAGMRTRGILAEGKISADA